MGISAQFSLLPLSAKEPYLVGGQFITQLSKSRFYIFKIKIYIAVLLVKFL